MSALLPRSQAKIAPGAVHVPDWLDLDTQRQLVQACREWATGPAGMRATRLPSGGVMSVRTVCLGWHWVPYRYSRTVDDGSPVREFPDWLGELARRAVGEAYDDPAAAEAYQPDIALINFYDDNARMGLHQDRDERSLAPVVSLSLGDACIFRFGNTRNRNRPWTDVELRSGDLFVFGGPSRLAFHGVPRGLVNPQPPDGVGGEIGLGHGRLNITIRESGLR
ncbi:alpha-ketoglutarate-dependent dioxygenase AlkB [Actinopolymorpha sp. B17G11]|uniref:alpha-ketoglutarate-dependent dioxygenase AlkB family protein n=1 Tax=Actinopolymorpha sp. B17G11 TaxID=3160861 RepID=UPI0032E3DCC6